MISGFFARGLGPQPWLRMSVVVPEFGPIAARFPFIVDTGATATVIHARDALFFFGLSPADLDSSMWTNAITVGGVGGSMLCKESSATFAFQNDDGTIDKIEGTVLIGDMRSAGLPSLLGRDLLRLFHLEIHGDESVALQRLVNPWIGLSR